MTHRVMMLVGACDIQLVNGMHQQRYAATKKLEQHALHLLYASDTDIPKRDVEGAGCISSDQPLQHLLA